MIIKDPTASKRCINCKHWNCTIETEKGRPVQGECVVQNDFTTQHDDTCELHKSI